MISKLQYYGVLFPPLATVYKTSVMLLQIIYFPTIKTKFLSRYELMILL